MAGDWKTCDPRCPNDYSVQNQTCSDPGLVCLDVPNYWKDVFCTIATCVCESGQCRFKIESGWKGGQGLCGAMDLSVSDHNQPPDAGTD
jgi:hypothetical protein